jgi:hypothetical protein
MGASPAGIEDKARGIHVAPVRHHSPACAAQLERMLAEIDPAAILIEGPREFEALIPLVADAATVPPVAIVAMRKVEGARRAASYYPLCAHSPEFVALRAGTACGIPVRFIDLPAAAPEMTDAEDEQDRSLMRDDSRFDAGDYVRALAVSLGVRDGNEAWDTLFESRIGESDWRHFFTDVAHYCACLRAATDAGELQRGGTFAREAQMRACLTEMRTQVKGPIVAVVGGFHAAALLEPDAAPVAVKAGVPGDAFLIRYGNRELNALAGYAAGLPLPGYYEAVWRARHEAAPFSALARDLIREFAGHLRESGAAAPSLPVMIGAIEHAHRLAMLRGRPGPMRTDLTDAVRATFVKEEVAAAGNPLLREFDAWLTGTAIGDVPPSAGSPPLIEAVRNDARSLGFKVNDGERRTRDLDIYRSDRHRAASRFCHAMAFIGAGFGDLVSGPDFRNDAFLDRLRESWSVCWSPRVEARLVELAAGADTLPEALAVRLAERLAGLREEGRGRDARAAIDLFVAACRGGIGDKAEAVLHHIEAEAIEDPDLGSVVDALGDLVALHRNRAMLEISDPAMIESLIRTLWRRALLLLPDVAAAGADQARPILATLVALRALVEMIQSGGTPIEVAPFEAQLEVLCERAENPLVAGAFTAFAVLAGRIDENRLAMRLKGELGSGYVRPEDRLGFLGGLIAIARELLWGVPALLEALDEVIAEADAATFLELLPHLRMAMMPLDPREIDRLAHEVARRLNATPAALAFSVSVSEAEMLANLTLDHELAAQLARDGVE